MKRHIIICTALLALMATACVKTPQIYRLLTKEEQEIVPYQFGQFIKMVNHQGDTIQYAVVRDELRLGHENEFYNPSKMKPNIPPYCYVRFVQLVHDINDCWVYFDIGPDQQLVIGWEYNQIWGGFHLHLPNMTTETLELNGITYENVYRAENDAYDIHGESSIQQTLFFSKEFGLLAIKSGDVFSLMRVP